MAKCYDTKIIKSGDIVEVYRYEKEVVYDFIEYKKGSKGRKSKAKQEDQEKNREKVFSRAKRDLRRIINCNVRKYSKFLTLTFKDEITDISKANRELKKFIQRLNYHYGYKIQYSCVPEIQEERLEKTGVAVWHYHLLLYNVIEKVDVKRLSEIWGNGFIKINSIKDVDNVGAYVCKYMTKQHKDRLQGKKMYFNSRNLKKPVEIKEEHALKEFAKTLKHAHLKYTNTFLNEYNSVQYSQYIISENDIASNNMDILEFTDCLQEHNKNLVSV